MIALIPFAPIHPLWWIKDGKEAQREIDQLEETLESIPTEAYFQLRGVLVQEKEEMVYKLKTQSVDVINFINQSNLTDPQKKTSIFELSQVVSLGLFFENIEMDKKSFETLVNETS